MGLLYPCEQHDGNTGRAVTPTGRHPKVTENIIGETMSTEEAAEFLGVRKSTLETWRAKRRGPKYCKPGGKRVTYRVADLRAYLAACAVDPEGGRAA
jgi:excisionase family DNA binding protein